MKSSITQQSPYGCGIACFAFVSGLTFDQAAEFLGRDGKTKEGVPLSEFCHKLNEYGLSYERRYVKPHLLERIENDGTIVLIARSKEYPVGHYLVRHNNAWMDPWINMLEREGMAYAISGYRKELPDRPVFALLPTKDR